MDRRARGSPRKEKSDGGLLSAGGEGRLNRLPDFFIVGHAKSGTTALYSMLRAHPQIYMPALKESHFFARDPERPASSSKHPLTLESYLSLFATATAQQRVGEASTSYLRSAQAPTRIAELCPQARIIALFREPADFLRSLHLQLLQSGIETEADFASAVGLEPQRRRGRDVPRDPLWAQALLYSEQVRYVAQLDRYHELFGRERVLALIYDDFRADNEGVVREIYRFLDVDDAAVIEQRRSNPTVRVRSHRAQAQLNALALGRGPGARVFKASMRAVVPAHFRRRALRVASRMLLDGSPPAPTEAFMRELRRRFEPEVRDVSDYLGRDLVKLWGYDSL